MRWSNEGRPIHLVRNVCDGCAVWCDGDHYDDSCTDEPQEADCPACLWKAYNYGLEARRRLQGLNK